METAIRTWAHRQFDGARLGNKARNRRLISIATALASKPGASLPQAMTAQKNLKAAYELFNLDKVTHAAIIRPHCAQVEQHASTQPGHYFLIQDKTHLDYTNRQVKNLGPIGDHNGQGIHVQTTLAVQVEPVGEGPQWAARTILGLFDQRLWTRDPDRPPTRQGTESWKQRQQRPDCESRYWGEALQQVPPLAEGVRWTYIADRDSDLTPILDGSRLAPDLDFIVRLYRNRRLEIDGQSLLLSEALEQAPVLGGMWVDVAATPGRPARRAKVEVRSRTLPLCLSTGKPLQVVELREVEVPEGVKEPIHWMLATTWPVETLEQALRVAQAYKLRWLVEEYHKAWKTGTAVEKAQLKSEHRLEALAAVLSVVAVRLLGMKLGLGPVGDEEEEKQVEAILEEVVGRPPGGWDERQKLRAIAKLGGFIGRKSDGEPGWQTIWRGTICLLEMLRGFRLAQKLSAPP